MTEPDARRHARERSRDGEDRFVVWDEDYETFRVVRLQTALAHYEERDIRACFSGGREER